jgi:elongation factor 2
MIVLRYWINYNHNFLEDITMGVNEKMVDKVARIIQNPEYIRNICTSAHIHHGKTAFTDNLLAAAGQMASKYAGDLDQGMTTWQHSDEQERLLTVDAANVSMVHNFDGKEFLINLIDTPGHIDFSGNVTRAMRAVDGTIVLVCAVEGVMPQTETVLKQALRERVRPVLFINKMDRLVKELKLSPEKIQDRLLAIYREFNSLVEKIAESEYSQKWKVDINDGSVAFGSARENWALSLPFMKKKGISFKDIIKIYEMSEEDRKKWVWENSPLHEVILDMVVKHMPNPKVAQAYRIPKIWTGDLESEFGKDLLTCNPNGKVAFVITRIVIEPRSGKEISAGRLFSGTLTEGMEVYLNLAKKKQRVQQVLVYNGIRPERMDKISAGNILAIAGVTGEAGESITLDVETPFEELKHIFEPVITKAIEPAKSADLPKLIEVLRKVAKEDPSIKVEINEETGENLISGMGELHLEIVENRIKTEKNVEVKTSEPIVVYRETITKPGQEYMGKSPNKHNQLFFKVEPLEDNIYQMIKSGEIAEGRIKKKDPHLRDMLMKCGMDSKTTEKVKDIFKGNVLIDTTRGIIHIGEIIEMVQDMFEDVMKGGPLAKEPCNKVKVLITDCKLHEDAIHRGPAQLYPAVREGIRGSMMTAAPLMLEPLQVQQIEAPVEYMGEMSKLVANKRGQLLEMNHEGTQVVIKAKLPVAEMIGWASDLRSATEGRGNSYLVDQMFEKLPFELTQKVIAQIKQRKGLTDAMLGV